MAKHTVETRHQQTGIRTLHDDHRKILALFQLCLAISQDSRRATVDQILEFAGRALSQRRDPLGRSCTTHADRNMSWSHVLREHDRGESYDGGTSRIRN